VSAHANGRPLARRFRRTAISRAGWNVADQALTSLTNAALSIFVARSVDANSFGAFAVCFSIYSLAIGATRTLVSDPLTVRFSAASPEDFARARRLAIAAAGGLGIVAGATLAIAAFALARSDELRDSLLALALTMPGLTLQDSLRLSFITAGRPSAAAVNDLLWAILQAGGLSLLLFADVSSAALFVVVWGAAAALSAVFGATTVRAVPAVRGALRWFREQLHLSRFFVSEYVAVMGAVQVALLVVGVLGDVADVGALRGGFVLLGPISVVFFGLTFFATPEIARRRALPQRTHLMSAAALSGSLLLATVVWGGAVLKLPDSAGRELLGDAWNGGRDVLPALIALQVAVAVAIGPACVMRAFGAARETFVLALVLAPLLLSFAAVGARLDGAVGAAAGLAIAQWIPVPLWWVRLFKVTNQGRAPAVAVEADQA
jgi:O-antigen/teichoic acid export membrane protein